MNSHGFFTYALLKIKVTILRFLLLLLPFLLQRDPSLVKSMAIHKQRILIPSRDRNRTIKADLYSPLNHTSNTLLAPVMVNWHGSGFIFSFFGMDTLFCAQMAKQNNMLVLDVDYRKAPENPYPCAIEDVEDTLLWIASQRERFDSSKIAVSGFSAGGNLALVAASNVRKSLADVVNIAIVLAIYPLTDHSIPPEKKKVAKPIKPFSPTILHLFSDCYVPNKNLRCDPRVSPGLADAIEFPDTVVMVTCEGDNLGPEGIALADRLRDGNRKVVNYIAKGLHHGWDKGCKEGTWDLEERERVYGLCVETVKEALVL